MVLHSTCCLLVSSIRALQQGFFLIAGLLAFLETKVLGRAERHVPACAGMGIHMGANRTRLYGLNLSRCLGDKFLKDQDLGLSAAPHVSPVVTLEPAAAGIVVLASDGLWDVADGAAAIKARHPMPSPAPLHSILCSSGQHDDVSKCSAACLWFLRGCATVADSRARLTTSCTPMKNGFLSVAL